MPKPDTEMEIPEEGETLPPPELTENPELETESSGLTIKQKASLFLAGVLSFIFFAILLFPYDEVVKNVIYKTKIPGITIDFSSLEFPFFGKKIIHSLSIQTSGGTNFKTEEFILDVSMFSFLASRNIMGEIKLNSVRIENNTIGFQFKTLFANSEIAGTDSIDTLKGSLMVRISGGSLFKIPEIPMLGQMEKLELNNSVLNFKLQNGSLFFQKNSNLNTSIAKIFLEGNIQMSQNPTNSAINLKLCPKFKPEFETERPDIVNTIQLLPKNEAGISCIPLTGTFQNPQLNIQMGQ